MLHEKGQSPSEAYLPWSIFFGMLAVAGAVIAVDVFLPDKPIDVVSSVYFGLLVGVLLTYILTIVLEPMLQGASSFVMVMSRLLIGMVLCYICISLLLQTKDDFRFIIPYVEFAKEVKGLKPYILDTSVVIDGRIADLVETNMLDNQLDHAPVRAQRTAGIADSSDKLRRRRGPSRARYSQSAAEQPARRSEDLRPRIARNGRPAGRYEAGPAGQASGGQGRHRRLQPEQGRPAAQRGGHQSERHRQLAQAGVPAGRESGRAHRQSRAKKPGKGVGYLDDGTMIVVEGGREHIGKKSKIAVTSVLQTSAGRMIFGRTQSS